MNDSQYFWYMVTNWVVAIGTVGAVIVALFGSWLRAKFPPVFEFKILKPEGELCPIKDAQQQTIADSRYYHVGVRNSRGWVRATHSQFRLIRIERPGPDGQPQVMWDGDIPMRHRHQEFYPTESVIGSAVDFDLCAIVRPRNNPAPQLQLTPILAPFNLQMPWTGETHFVASFQMKCAERDSKVMGIQFDWDGTFHEGDAEMERSFKVKIKTG